MMELHGSWFFQESFPIYLNRIGELFEQPQHKHDFIEINYVAEGKGTHYIDKRSVPSGKGDVFFLPVGTSHVFRPSSADPRKPLIVYNCLFPDELISRRQAQLPQLPLLGERLKAPAEGGGWFQVADTNGDFHRLFTGMYVEYTRKAPAHEAVVYGQWLQLLGLIERELAGATKAAGDEREALFGEALACVRTKLQEPRFGAKDVAAKLGIGVPHVYRLFRECAGMTFLSYVQQERIEQSCRLLRETSAAIPQIAEQCGYQDKKYFHRLFKRMIGESPHQYRLKRTKRSGL